MAYLGFNHHPYVQAAPQPQQMYNPSAMFGYALAHTHASMAGLATGPKPSDTKPRLGKDEVDMLEREFQKNPKPTTQTKRGFAEEMGVDLPRINNWFQNRRAKRKQEKKQEAYEAAQRSGHVRVDANSPTYISAQSLLDDDDSSASIPSRTSPGPVMASPAMQAAAATSAQQDDAASSSMALLTDPSTSSHVFESQDDGYPCVNARPTTSMFPGPLGGFHDVLGDRMQFPLLHHQNSQSFDDANVAFPLDMAPSTLGGYASTSTVVSPSSVSPGAIYDLSASESCPPLSDGESNAATSLNSFVAQDLYLADAGLPLVLDNSAGLGSGDHDSSADYSIGLVASESTSMSASASPGLFKPPPPPMDIASRRKKVQKKPAALDPDAMKHRPMLGPRTVSQAEGFQRVASPLDSPMRRIASAGGHRNVLSGRIQKSGFENTQRSPLHFQTFQDVGAIMEAHKQNIRCTPTLMTSLAPLTPLSPGLRTASASPPNMMSAYQHGPMSSLYASAENLASPPETPQANFCFQQMSQGWNNGHEETDPWSIEPKDEPQFTPAQESFPSDSLYLSQANYNASQPVTPGLTNFSGNDLFGFDSPHMDTSTNRYPNGGHRPEFTLGDSASFQFAMSDAISKQKTFEFSNTTQADFNEK